MRIRSRAATILMGVMAGALATQAGDLDPPPGPTAPTMKTIEQAEPRIPIGPDTTPGDATSVYRITEPGSYYLTGAVQGEAGKHGVRIDPAIGGGLYTIDLNGFSLVGVPGSLDGLNTGARCNVRNGSADNWGANGITVGEGTIQNVSALSNGAIGIRAAWGNIVLNCRAEANGSHGISVGDVSRVASCVAKLNTGRGIQLDGAGTITDCVLYNNDAGGIDTGFATIERNFFFSNTGPAIEDRGGSSIADNTITTGSTGVLCTGAGSRVENNTVIQCATGFDVDGTDNIIIGNTASGCATAFDIAADNSRGPLIDATTTDDLATLPNAAHPRANFEY